MDKMVTAVIKGEERLLNYSIEIMFKVHEKFGGITQALAALDGDDKKSVEDTLWLLTELVNDGELCRRAANLEPMEMLSTDTLMRISPVEYIRYKDSVIKAILAGYGREIPGEDEIDLGLAELNEKKAPAGA